MRLRRFTSYLCAVACAATMIAPVNMVNAKNNKDVVSITAEVPSLYSKVSTMDIGTNDEETIPIVHTEKEANSLWVVNEPIEVGEKKTYSFVVKERATLYGLFSADTEYYTHCYIYDEAGNQMEYNLEKDSNIVQFAKKTYEPGRYTLVVDLSLGNQGGSFKVALQGYDARKTASAALGKTYLYMTEGDIYRKVTVKKQSLLAVAASAKSIQSNSEGGVNVTLCDSKKKEISEKNYSSSYNKYCSLYGVKPGTYYVKFSSNYSGYLSAYQVKVQKTGNAVATAKKKAKKLTSKVKNYILPANNKKDASWYKVTLKSKKKHRLTVAYGGNDRVYCEIYKGSKCIGSSYLYANGKGWEVMYKTLNGFGKETTWPKGTYYLKVSKCSKKTSGMVAVKMK